MTFTALFQGIFDTSSTQVISTGTFLLCMLTGFVCGILLYLLTLVKGKYNSTFAVCVTLLPSAVCMVIMMVNGNIGASLSVAGAFSLIRFRSGQGNAMQMITVFIAMTAGLVTGMGYLAYAVLFTFISGIAMDCFLLFFEKFLPVSERFLYITVPESLNYGEVIDGVISDYTSESTLEHVRTSNMGSLFKLTYRIKLNRNVNEKEMIDELRQYNGNLEIHMARCEAEEMTGM